MTTINQLPGFPLFAAAIGQRVVTVEPIGHEFRWRHFMRRQFIDDEQPFGPNYLPVFALRTVQGEPEKKPRWDSGEGSVASQVPGSTLVVDASHISHDDYDKPKPHDGLVVVEMMGWTGFYVKSFLLHRISPYEHGRVHLTLVAAIIAAAGDLTVSYAKAEWKREIGILPDDLKLLDLVFN